MPSQEDYLDNLLKGIENTEEEENSRKESEEGIKDETLQDPQIDMSDMDDLLQSALEAQQRDIPETQQSQNTQNSETIHPEETSSMSEDEIDRLLQQSREQAGSTLYLQEITGTIPTRTRRRKSTNIFGSSNYSLSMHMFLQVA